MRIRRTWMVLLVGALLSVPAASAEAKRRCPPRGHATIRHCLLVQVKRTTDARAGRLAALLVKAGYKAARGGASVELHANARELRRLFRAKYVYRRVAASARSGWVCAAYVAGVRVPAKYASWIGNVSVGHQICE